MKRNIGEKEQMCRVAWGASALTAAVLMPRLGGWRWVLGAIGAAELIQGMSKFSVGYALAGVDNTQGKEMLHFDESIKDVRGRVGHRLNEFQHKIGATLS